MKQYLIPEPVLHDLLGYLLTKRMREVEPAVMTLRNLREAPTPDLEPVPQEVAL